MKRFFACFTLVCFLAVVVMIPYASANVAGQQIAAAISSYIGSYGVQWTANNLRDGVAMEAMARDIDKFVASTGVYETAQEWLEFGKDVLYRQPGQFVFNQTAAIKAAEFAGWFTAKYGLTESGKTSVVQENDIILRTDDGVVLYQSEETQFMRPLVDNRMWLTDKVYCEITSITAGWNPESTASSQSIRLMVGFFFADGTLITTESVSFTAYKEPDYSKVYAKIAPANNYDYVGFDVFVVFPNVGKSSNPDRSKGWQFSYAEYPDWGITIQETGTLSVTAPEVITSPPVDSMTAEQSLVIDTGVTSSDIDDLIAAINALIVSNLQTKTEYIIIDKAYSEDEIIDGLTWQERLAAIGDDIRALPGEFADAIAGVFVPDAVLTQQISGTFTNKFGFLGTIHQVGSDLLNMDADTTPPVIYIHLEDAEGRFVYGGTEKALDMAWYQRYKANGDAIISGFLWLGFLWMVFKRASAIIQGGEMVSEIAPDIGRGYRKRGD